MHLVEQAVHGILLIETLLYLCMHNSRYPPWAVWMIAVLFWLLVNTWEEWTRSWKAHPGGSVEINNVIRCNFNFRSAKRSHFLKCQHTFGPFVKKCPQIFERCCNYKIIVQYVKDSCFFLASSWLMYSRYPWVTSDWTHCLSQCYLFIWCVNSPQRRQPNVILAFPNLDQNIWQTQGKIMSHWD